MSTGKRCPHQIMLPGVAWATWSCDVCHDVGVRMRALSLHDPYPQLILDLPDEHRKDIENRKRSVMSELGPLLIHVAASATPKRHAAALEVARKAGVPEALLPTEEDRQLGGIVGCVWVGQVLPESSLFDRQYRWKFPGYVGYVLPKRVKLPFRKVSGGQGIFHVDLTAEEQRLIEAAGIL